MDQKTGSTIVLHGGRCPQVMVEQTPHSLNRVSGEEGGQGGGAGGGGLRAPQIKTLDSLKALKLNYTEGENKVH